MKYTSICKALYDYKAQSEDELTFKEDDVLYILDKEEDPDWWKAQLKAASLDQVGPVGLVPANYVDEAEPIGTVKALYDYTAQQDEELSFQEDDVMILYENDDPDWFLVKAKNGTIGLVPSNYIEEVSNQQVANNAATQQHSEPVSSTTAHVEAQPPVSVFSALSNANTASDEVISWSVNEYDVDKKKKKKSKGNLLVGNGMLCYGSETDKASPVRQYTITDISTSSMDGKNIHIEIADAARTALDFQAASKSEAKAIVAKIEESQRLTNAQQQQQHEPPSPAQNVYYQPAQPEPQPQHQYQPEPEPEPKPEPVHESEPEPPCEPRWAIALYDFNAEGPGELSIKEYDQVLVTDYVSSDEWWNVEYQDGRAGIVPATYVQFQDEYEADLRKEEEQRRKQEEEEQERQRREAEAAAARQRRLQEEEERRRQEEERARQAEAERQRKLEEEKRKREQEAKRQVAAVSSPVAQGSASPRRSQIPAPPPPVKPAPGRTMPSPRTVQSIPVPNNRSLPDRPKQAQDPGKPDPSKVRTWTDRTGAFKVEAQFLAYHNGKIRLHKINGVKIDVPVQKMCIDDLRYIEQETGERLVDDKSDDIPLAHIANKNRDWDWFEYFMKVNIPRESSQRYATAFQNEKLGPADLDNLTHRKMKSLGMSESHVQRLQRYLETNVAEPPSDDESAPKKKAKKTVTFGGTSIIEDGNDYMDNTQRQIEEDEKLARRLQEEFNSGRSDAPAAAPQGVNLQRRGTGRPSPNTSAPKGVNSDYMEKIKSQLSAQPLQPTPAASSSPSQRPQSQAAPSPPPPAPPAPSAPSAPPAPSTVSQSGFADDAWTPRPSSSRSVAPKPDAATSSGWSSSPVSAAQNTAPVPLPPRQRPTPPTSQQIKIDPQLLSQWTGSPKQQQQSQQQLQQQPTQPSAQQTQQQQPAPQMQIQQPQFQQPTQVHQQPQIPQPQPQPQLSHVQQMAMQFNQQQQQQQTPPVPPRSPSQFASQQFMQPPQFQQQQQQPSPIQAQQFVQQQVPLNSTLPQPLLPTNTGMQTGLQSSGVASQPTGMRSWANATPDNPFGGSPSPRPPAPVPQQQTGFPANNSLQPSQVFASMTGNNSFVNAQQQQQLGYMQTSLPGDKYAVFKSVDVNASSVFNSGGQQQQQQHPGMTPFQQPQATGFVPMQHQQNFGNPQAFGQPQQQQPFYNRW